MADIEATAASAAARFAYYLPYVSHSGQVAVAITAAVVAAAAVAGATAAATAATLIHAGCCGCAVADASNCWLLLLLLLP